MFIADDFGRERLGRGGEGIDGGIDAEFRNRALEHDGGVQVGEGVCGGGIGQIVRRNIDCLEGSDRTILRGGDPLLELTHFRGKGGLITDGARRASQQRGKLPSRPARNGKYYR